ncbi:MAG TPA: MlaD family protein [Luteibacter sp.]|jgi:phospholipid/cholesterol/gamma-HCH transport system substrate-binding protein|nr:MlaD family protein [Luteibacter sp.]
METRAHHVIIGLFAVIVVFGALAFGVWLVKASSEREFFEYDIVFNEAVTGLSQGGPVQYNGIRIGDVRKLSLDPEDQRRVIARIRVRGDTPLKEDTHAKLALTGITGIVIIQLSGGSPGSKLLVGTDGRVAVIVADPSPLTKLLASGEDLVTNIAQVANSANQLLSPVNMKHIEHTLDNLERTTGVIADQREDIRQLLQQVAVASKQANLTLAKADQLLDNASGLVNGQGKATLDSAQRSMASLERATASIDRLLNDNSDALNGGAQGLANLGPAIRELRATLVQLHSITRRLDDNPSGYLLGRDRTKEFTP